TATRRRYQVIRSATAIAFLSCLSPSWLCAQTTEFKVTTETAQIYQAPSTGSVVIGRVPRGTVFEVTRELGSWVKILWPAAPDGSAYVHVSWGTVTHGVPPTSTRAAEKASREIRSDTTPPAVDASAERPPVSTRSSSRAL